MAINCWPELECGDGEHCTKQLAAHQEQIAWKTRISQKEQVRRSWPGKYPAAEEGVEHRATWPVLVPDLFGVRADCHLDWRWSTWLLVCDRANLYCGLVAVDSPLEPGVLTSQVNRCREKTLGAQFMGRDHHSSLQVVLAWNQRYLISASWQLLASLHPYRFFTCSLLLPGGWTFLFFFWNLGFLQAWVLLDL